MLYCLRALNSSQLITLLSKFHHRSATALESVEYYAMSWSSDFVSIENSTEFSRVYKQNMFAFTLSSQSIDFYFTASKNRSFPAEFFLILFFRPLALFRHFLQTYFQASQIFSIFNCLYCKEIVINLPFIFPA